MVGHSCKAVQWCQHC